MEFIKQKKLRKKVESCLSQERRLKSRVWFEQDIHACLLLIKWRRGWWGCASWEFFFRGTTRCDSPTQARLKGVIRLLRGERESVSKDCRLSLLKFSKYFCFFLVFYNIISKWKFLRIYSLRGIRSKFLVYQLTSMRLSSQSLVIFPSQDKLTLTFWDPKKDTNSLIYLLFWVGPWDFLS